MHLQTNRKYPRGNSVLCHSHLRTLCGLPPCVIKGWEGEIPCPILFMPDDIQFNFRIPPVPEGEALTFEEIEKRLKGHLEEKGGECPQTLYTPTYPRS